MAIAKTLKEQYNFVFVYSSEPPHWLREELENLGAQVDSIMLHTDVHGFRSIDRLCKTYKPDIVHLHHFSLLSPFIPYLALRQRLKVIVHIQSISPYNVGKTRFSTWLIPLRKRITTKTIDCAIAVSEFVKKKTATAFPFRNGQLVAIHNGAEMPNSLSAEKTNVRLNLGFPKDALIILTAAWLVKIKGVDVLIKSFPRVLGAVNQSVVIIVVGYGPERENLENMVKFFKIRKAVHFMGWRNDVPNLIEQADIIIVPSVCEEACPYFILEAMVAGKPIVASDIGGIPELLGNGKPVGILVWPNDEDQLAAAIINLIKDSRKRQELAHQAKERSLKYFHIAKQIDAIDAIYRRLLA